MKKITKSVRYALIAAATLVAAGAFTAASKPDFALGRNIQILFNMFRDVSAFYVDSVDTDEMLRDAAAGMTSNLDPYTVLIPEDEMEEFEILTTGKYGGIGALVRQSGDWIAIAQPYEGFPADKAGLVIGDKLLEVDGRSIRGLDVSEVSSMLKGSPGTALRLKVEKLLTGEQADVTLRRERIEISGIPYYGMIADGVGYVLHDDFTEECSLDMRRALVELKKQGATSLIIDLRGNGGGILQEAVKILSLLVPKGTEVVSMKGRIGELDETFTTQTDPIDTRMPVVVLVNSQSASAAEIVSGALQDLDRAVLLGQRTFGKGLVQSTRPLGYNAFLKVTTAKYYIPSGRCIQALDYAHRNDDGSVGTVPDSLIREFRTSGGRKVYDGGGVMPDVRIEPQYVSRFTTVLYGKGYLEDFANDYFRRHREGVDVDRFTLPDDEYDRFVEFMQDKDVEVESQTQRTVDELRRQAEREKYLDRISGELEAIERKLKDDKNADLQAFREDIRKLLESEIVMRYHYYAGVARHSALRDRKVRAAVELLADTARYRRILSQQDTERK